MKSRFLKMIIFIVAVSLAQTIWADDLISLFPIENYDQTIAHWIHPSDPNFNQPLLTSAKQKILMNELNRHYFSDDKQSMSPWNKEYIVKIFSSPAPDDLFHIFSAVFDKYANTAKNPQGVAYGENYRPLPESWFAEIKNNIPFSQLKNLQYDAKQRAIAIDNLYARNLPTDAMHFYDHKIPGEGFPFDNLQASAVWAGTPLYIICESNDRAWDLVITPDYFIAWVKSNGVARVNDSFIKYWRKAAHQLVAITRTQIPVIDAQQQFRFSGYVGMFFPLEKKSENEYKILIPVTDNRGNALIRYASLSTNQAVLMPMIATPHAISTIMSQLINRPYGWGNFLFYNDCSAELKSLLAPFGIWLPRHSSYQVDPEKVLGQHFDFAKGSIDERLASLKAKGHPFMTVIYIGHHVMLYLGELTNDVTKQTLPLVYENMWGLSENPAKGRVVIGESVLFPLLKSYPENSNLVTQIAHTTFEIQNLDELPSEDSQFRSTEFNKLDMKALLSP